MEERDLILNGRQEPTLEMIRSYLDETATPLWDDLNSFIQERYGAHPKISFSKCSGKPGWNVKYHKSGKSICTLYPEKERFIVLVVVTLDLARAIEGSQSALGLEIPEIARSARPFNGTKWLMIPVHGKESLDAVIELLCLKQPPKSCEARVSTC